MRRAKDRPTLHDLPPAFNVAVGKVLAYRPKKRRARLRDHREATPA